MDKQLSYTAGLSVEANKDTESFAKGLNGYKLVWIFVICSIMGYLVEMGWCYLYHGFFESRKSLLYGPFSIIYGIGAVLVVKLVDKLKNQKNFTIFMVAAMFGTAFEYICSVLQELIFGSVSWDYSGKPFTIGGRASLIFSIGWGFLAIFVLRMLLPKLNQFIESIPNHSGRIITWVVIVFMAGDLFLSAAAVLRQNERREGIPPSSRFEQFLDDHYPDEFLNQVYVNMRIAGTRLIRDDSGRVVK